ncbi:hypothetical protein PIB30_022237 [Stylosanthes scabra]|uniref:Uncharacterized protein n=1 Tax=Stylosanthes scabra TaxID=79078 RepID=A0ABU6Q8T2_9FABA|nr:hypothetical protein [Stylosanthes scabra]
MTTWSDGDEMGERDLVGQVDYSTNLAYWKIQDPTHGFLHDVGLHVHCWCHHEPWPLMVTIARRATKLDRLVIEVGWPMRKKGKKVVIAHVHLRGGGHGRQHKEEGEVAESKLKNSLPYHFTNFLTLNYLNLKLMKKKMVKFKEKTFK